MPEELLKEFNKELIALLNKYNLKLTVDTVDTVEINLRDINN